MKTSNNSKQQCCKQEFEFWRGYNAIKDLSGKHFESARQENYLLCVYPEFSFGNQSCHFLESFLCMTGSH